MGGGTNTAASTLSTSCSLLHSVSHKQRMRHVKSTQQYSSWNKLTFSSLTWILLAVPCSNISVVVWKKKKPFTQRNSDIIYYIEFCFNFACFSQVKLYHFKIWLPPKVKREKITIQVFNPVPLKDINSMINNNLL